MHDLIAGSRHVRIGASGTGGQRRHDALQAMLAALGGLAGLVPLAARADPDDVEWGLGRKPGRGWRMIGEKQAGRSLDRDEIRVRAERACTALRPRVFHAPVEFLKVQVRFRNGESHEIEVRQRIEKRGATRVIDLPGEKRFIDRIVFWYRTPALAREPATVQVWARG